MTIEESGIYELLRRYPNRFLSVTDISKSIGSMKDFHRDRLAALPVLRRMELEGWVEANSFGEYRLKHRPDETTTFKEALETPGMALGDTAIIVAKDSKTKQAA